MNNYCPRCKYYFGSLKSGRCPDCKVRLTAGRPQVSATPETDGLREELRGNSPKESFAAMLSHARKLEHERDAARKAAPIRPGNDALTRPAQPGQGHEKL